MLQRSPPNGLAIEIGSGAGFAKEIIADLITTDIIAYPSIDCVVDACRMPFADESLRMICMWNVFHHIPDSARFLREVDRCLVPGGRLLIADQHIGVLSRPIFKFLHHENFDADSVGMVFSRLIRSASERERCADVEGFCARSSNLRLEVSASRDTKL